MVQFELSGTTLLQSFSNPGSNHAHLNLHLLLSGYQSPLVLQSRGSFISSLLGDFKTVRPDMYDHFGSPQFQNFIAVLSLSGIYLRHTTRSCPEGRVHNEGRAVVLRSVLYHHPPEKYGEIWNQNV